MIYKTDFKKNVVWKTKKLNIEYNDYIERTIS